jgi:hypothetical protein
MKLPGFKRIYKADYPADFQQVVEKLAQSINVGLENVYLALSRKLTVRDNIASTVKDVELTVNSSGIPITTVGFVVDNNSRVDGIQVWKVDNLDNTGTYPTSGVHVSWTQGNAQTASSIFIDHVTGLQANQKYRLRIVAYYQ